MMLMISGPIKENGKMISNMAKGSRSIQMEPISKVV